MPLVKRKRQFSDLILATLLIAGGAFGLSAIQKRGFFESGSRESLSISVGNLTDQKGEVRYRFGDSVIWKEAKDSEQVAFGDAIFTAKDGQAKVHFMTGREATILPNSMVVIHAPDKSETNDKQTAVIEIQKGKIALKREHGKALEPFLVKANGKIYKVEAEAVSQEQATTETSANETLTVSLPEPVAPNESTAPKTETASPLKIESSSAIKITEVAPAASEPAKPKIIEAAPETKTVSASEVKEKVPAVNKPERKPASQSNPAPAIHKEIVKEPVTPALEQSAPKALPEELSKKTTSSGSYLELTPYYGLDSITVSDKLTGVSGRLAATTNLGIDLRLIHEWKAGFKSFLHLKIGTLSFAQPSDNTRTLQNSSNFMPGVGLGAEFPILRTLSLGVFGDYQKEVFVRSSSTTSVTVDAFDVPEIGGKINFDVYEEDDAKLGINGQFTELFSADGSGYNALSGNRYGGGVYLTQEFLGIPITGEISYLQRTQNTTATNQSEKDVILTLTWSIPSRKKTEDQPK